MTQLIVDISENEEEFFINEISKFPFVNSISHYEKQLALNSIESGLREIDSIIKGEILSLSEEEFFNELDN